MIKPRKTAYCVSALLAALAFECSAQTGAARPDTAGSAPVTIVGPLPVPVTGSTTVSGTVSLTSGSSVSIGNTATNPVLVRDVDNAARHPFQLRLCFASGLTGLSCHDIPAVVSVPSDRRLVIEYVSAECIKNVGTNIDFGVATQVGGVPAKHYLAIVANVTDSSRINAAQQTRIYADPGSDLVFAIGIGGSGTGTGARCEMTLSGYSIVP